MEGFRFPPMEAGRPIVYTESKRLAFRALYEVATNCLSGLLLRSLSENVRGGGCGSSSSSSNCSGVETRGREEKKELRTRDTRTLYDALLRTNCGNNKHYNNNDDYGNEQGDDDGSCCRHGLFRHDVNEPFEKGMPFSQSFFNLFNYG
eukprot:CAMPEP_0196146036 /NCGR_PEP_ID=MMETSP0910-20130528/21992_1 /TAXON_ID=49265 /ORGANISM="Thalassiosira rotula, Strain GSO102" /LENGTH=147 /DNA_ID=CAMNT_0041408161 /DNA_START=74 /DNA_END=513 /DNA_ORIENTATION=+